MALDRALGSAARPLFYLAIPPGLFGPVAKGIAALGCGDSARLVVEKPFGRDLASARALDQVLINSSRNPPCTESITISARNRC